MKADELLELIGEAEDAHIQSAGAPKKHSRRTGWLSALAACLCLVLGGIWMLQHLGGNAGTGGRSDQIYMNYVGPVLPLSVMEDAGELSALRHIGLDFSPYEGIPLTDPDGETQTRWRSEILVTDQYILSNESGQDQTVTLLYPHIGSLRQTEFFPTLTVNGEAVPVTPHPGPYSGGFSGVWGADDPDGTCNLALIDRFEGYETLLSTDDYLRSAFDAFPDLDIPVVVYRLQDFEYTADEEAESPSMLVEFSMDYDQTQILTYGFNGAAFDRENGSRSCIKGAIEHRPDAPPGYQEPDDGFILILGREPTSYTLQGYRNGGCEAGDDLNDLKCMIVRSESTLNEMLAYLMDDFYGRADWYQDHPELAQGLVIELLVTFGVLGESPVERYDSNMLEDLFSAAAMDRRVIYFSVPVTIPAGAQITVEASMLRDESCDFTGPDQGKDGYDLATRLGSRLHFTGQSADISGWETVDIVGQNFGFDPAGGITEVTLDLNQPHYWIEVRRHPAE